MEESIWKGEIRKNTHLKAMGLYNRIEREVCTQKRESVFTVERRKRGDTSIYRGPTAKRIYLAIKITRPHQSIL